MYTPSNVPMSVIRYAVTSDLCTFERDLSSICKRHDSLYSVNYSACVPPPAVNFLYRCLSSVTCMWTKWRHTYMWTQWHAHIHVNSVTCTYTTQWHAHNTVWTQWHAHMHVNSVTCTHTCELSNMHIYCVNSVTCTHMWTRAPTHSVFKHVVTYVDLLIGYATCVARALRVCVCMCAYLWTRRPICVFVSRRLCVFVCGLCARSCVLSSFDRAKFVRALACLCLRLTCIRLEPFAVWRMQTFKTYPYCCFWTDLPEHEFDCYNSPPFSNWSLSPF
jgi:hypothetical protein